MIKRGVVGSLLMWLGSVLALTPMSSTTSGRMQSLAIVLVGLALLGSAWISLLGRPDSLPLVRRAVIAWSVPLAFAPPMFSRDGWSYAAQSYLTHLHLSPYVWSPQILEGPLRDHVDPMWMNTPAPYGPVPLLWGALASVPSHNPWWLVIANRLLAFVGIALLMWAIPRLARWAGVSPARATALGVASPLMIANGVGGLHNDVLMIGIAAVALAVGLERNWIVGCALAGLAAAVKLPGGLVAIGIVLASLPADAPVIMRVRRFALGAVAAVGVLALTGMPMGLGFGWVKALGVPGVVETPLSAMTMLGKVTIGTGPMRLVGEALAVGVIAWVALKFPTGSKRMGVRGATVALLALVLLGPVVHLWYLLWVTPLVAAIALSKWQSFALVTVSIVGGLAAPLDSSLHGLYLVVLGGAVMAIALAAVLLVLQPHRERVTEFVRVRE